MRISHAALADEKLIPSYHLKEVVDTLIASSKEKNIKGIFISGGFAPSGYGCGYETILEFRRALEIFKQSGKKIIGYLHSPRQLDYLVYSVCDELIMDPAGYNAASRFVERAAFLGDTFKKYGIGVQVVRTGRYKGAVEPFTNNKFSAENRNQVQNLWIGDGPIICKVWRLLVLWIGRILIQLYHKSSMEVQRCTGCRTCGPDR